MLPNLDYLIRIAKRAGEILKEGYLQQHVVQHKGRVDLVTEMDHYSEEYLLGEIRRDFKNHTIITEESGVVEGEKNHCWFIDPLDGTSNYAHGVPIFCVTVAYAFQNQVVLGVTFDPTREQCFYAERGQGAFLNGQRLSVSTTHNLIDAMLVTGFSPSHIDQEEKNLKNFSAFLKTAQSIRRLGSAALDIAYVAAGWMDGYWEISSHPWDVATGTLLVEEAGGFVTNLQGDAEYFQPPFSLIAANPFLHQEMKQVIQTANAPKKSPAV